MHWCSLQCKIDIITCFSIYFNNNCFPYTRAEKVNHKVMTFFSIVMEQTKIQSGPQDNDVFDSTHDFVYYLEFI